MEKLSLAFAGLISAGAFFIGGENLCQGNQNDLVHNLVVLS